MTPTDYNKQKSESWYNLAMAYKGLPDNPDEFDLELFNMAIREHDNTLKNLHDGFYRQFPWYQVYWYKVQSTPVKYQEAEKIYKIFTNFPTLKNETIEEKLYRFAKNS
jgi:hypothetical protein